MNSLQAKLLCHKNSIDKIIAREVSKLKGLYCEYSKPYARKCERSYANN